MECNQTSKKVALGSRTISKEVSDYFWFIEFENIKNLNLNFPKLINFVIFNSTAFKKQNSDASNVKIYKVPFLIAYRSTKFFANYAVPSEIKVFIEILFDLNRNTLRILELVYVHNCNVKSFGLHLFIHVLLYNLNSLASLWSRHYLKVFKSYKMKSVNKIKQKQYLQTSKQLKIQLICVDFSNRCILIMLYI